MKSIALAFAHHQQGPTVPLRPRERPAFKVWAYRRDRWVALFDVGELTAYADEGELEDLTAADAAVFQRALGGCLNGVPPWGSLPSVQDVKRGERLAGDAVSLAEWLVDGSSG